MKVLVALKTIIARGRVLTKGQAIKPHHPAFQDFLNIYKRENRLACYDVASLSDKHACLIEDEDKIPAHLLAGPMPESSSRIGPGMAFSKKVTLGAQLIPDASPTKGMEVVIGTPNPEPPKPEPEVAEALAPSEPEVAEALEPQELEAPSDVEEVDEEAPVEPSEAPSEEVAEAASEAPSEEAAEEVKPKPRGRPKKI
jgi:hypothetical protein